MKRYGFMHAVAALAATMMFIGCGAVDEGEGEGEGDYPTAEVEQAIAGGGSSCCSSGSFYCPSTGESFDYGIPGCGDGGTRLNMRAACNGQCSATCVDSGWHNGC